MVVSIHIKNVFTQQKESAEMRIKIIIIITSKFETMHTLCKRIILWHMLGCAKKKITQLTLIYCEFLVGRFFVGNIVERTHVFLNSTLVFRGFKCLCEVVTSVKTASDCRWQISTNLSVFFTSENMLYTELWFYATFFVIFMLRYPLYILSFPRSLSARPPT